MPPDHEMTSLERVLTTMGYREPDRVPLFLLVTMHGAKELGLSIREYFSKAENVVEGQLRLRKRYRNDCVIGFFYAPAEVEAWGAEVIYVDDGPPNSGRPFIRKKEDILRLCPPDVERSPSLAKVLKAEELLKERAGPDVPIIGVVMSPFSLPVMQMGFDRYLDLMHESPDIFDRLMRVNEEFCVKWANAQLKAGATVIVYYDPVSSPTVVSRREYLQMGFRVAQRTIAGIQGPTATHFASGICLPVIDAVAETGTKMIGVSVDESLAKVKEASRQRLGVVGNLNGIEMRRWSPEHAEEVVKATIADGGLGVDLSSRTITVRFPFKLPMRSCYPFRRRSRSGPAIHWSGSRSIGVPELARRPRIFDPDTARRLADYATAFDFLGKFVGCMSERSVSRTFSICSL